MRLWPIKRIFDIFVAAVAIVALSPIILLLAILVRVAHGSPVIFKQKRPGLRGRPFYIYKFRSMHDGRDEKGELLPPEKRLTTFGRLLRSTSLDELPELINVLKGDMSLVGPRPLLLKYLDRFTPEQGRRHEVRPGITGWAQINGRNILTWEDKFRLDVWYVDNWSLWLDFKILYRTVAVVLDQRGIAPEGRAVMTEFLGSRKGDSGL